MEQLAALLSSNAAVLWIGGTQPEVSVDEIIDEITYHTKVEKAYFRVVPHFPEDFIVRFGFHHHRDLLTTSPGRFVRGRLDIHANNWRANAHADVTKLNYHVHLQLENVPLHGWDEELVSDIIGDDCVLHYFDTETTQKEDASAVKLWAWCSDPALIPRVDWLTIVDKPQAIGSHPSSGVMGRSGLAGRVLIHLDLLEDFSPDSAGVVPRGPWASKPFRIQLGVIDGESERRELARPSRRDQGHGRRDGGSRREDDDDHDRRGRNDDRGWASRIFRSRSRAPAKGSHREDGRREDECRRSSNGRRGDERRDDDRRDRRRADLSLVQRLPGVLSSLPPVAVMWPRLRALLAAPPSRMEGPPATP